MILDRLKKIEENVDEEIIEQVCEEFDIEINNIDRKQIHININIINRIKLRIMKNLKNNNLDGKSKGYDNNEEKSIKIFKSRLKTK